jgi:hypothetical protein
MTTHPICAQLLGEITDELEHTVLTILVERAGQKTTRQDMVLAVYGKYVQANQLAGCIEDRRIRACIERLRSTWPIVSSSKEPGYILEDDENLIRQFATEQESRAEKNRQAAREAYNWLPRARSIREARRAAAKQKIEIATQPQMI